MPVVAAYMIYAGATAVTVSTFGAIMAGAMVVGGAVSLVGTITGDEKLERDGMMIGTIGSLGGMAAGNTAAAAGAESSAPAADVTATNINMGPTTGADPITGAMTSTTANTAATAQGAQEAASLVSKFEALEKAQNLNMIGNVAQGVSTAYSSHEQSSMLQDQEEKRRADQQALIGERRRNMDLTGLKINTPKIPQVLKPGLINQPNAVTGSGRTMMQIK